LIRNLFGQSTLCPIGGGGQKALPPLQGRSQPASALNQTAE
jgi:hypothetical protein